MTLSEYRAAYDAIIDEMMDRQPSEIAASHYANKLQDLMDAHPGLEDLSQPAALEAVDSAISQLLGE